MNRELRLILGVGRSGTTWLMEVLSKTSTSIRAISEPLANIRHYVPDLPKHIQNHQLYKTNYAKYDTLDLDSPIRIAYEGCMGTYIKKARHLFKNDENWKYLLIKEVNCLLSSEALIKHFKDRIKVIFIVRDPIYVLDSLFATQGWQRSINVYLKRESEFFEIILPESIKNVRDKQLAKKLITISKIHSFFYDIKNHYKNNVYLVNYEDICKDPLNIFEKLTKFFNFSWDSNIKKFLDCTLECSNLSKKNDPYSVFKNTAEQLNRPYKYFNYKEVEFCKSILEEI